MEIDRIIEGDCLQVMKQFPDNFIDLTVTSPPYDNLRKYHGYTFDFEPIAKELFRVTKPGGVVVWAVGDSTTNFCESLTSFKQAIYFHEIGFNLLDTMIYYKKNYAPAYPTLRRYANQFEYMFVFSKGKPKTFNVILVDKADSTKKRQKTSYKTSFIKNDGSRTETKENRSEIPTKAATNVWKYFSGSESTKDSYAFNHPAIFPEQLAADHILSWSNPGDLILDPMCGSGTTCKMAKYHDRHFLGIDVSKEYCEIARKRIAALPRKLTDF